MGSTKAFLRPWFCRVKTLFVVTRLANAVVFEICYSATNFFSQKVKFIAFQEESKTTSEPDKELTDVAAEAMSLQPTGHTLATTQVTMWCECILDNE